MLAETTCFSTTVGFARFRRGAERDEGSLQYPIRQHQREILRIPGDGGGRRAKIIVMMLKPFLPKESLACMQSNAQSRTSHQAKSLKQRVPWIAFR